MAHTMLNLVLLMAMTLTMPATRDVTPEEDARDWALRGISLFNNKEYQGAIDCYKESLRIHGPNALALLGRGAANSALGEYKSALRDFEASIKADSYCATSADASKLLYKKEDAEELALSYRLQEQTGLKLQVMLKGKDRPSMILARAEDPAPLISRGLKKLTERDLVSVVYIGGDRWQFKHLAENKKKVELYLVLLEDETWNWQEKPLQQKKRIQ